MNELQRLNRAVAIHTGRRRASEKEMREAWAYLNKVHDKYGTVDVGIIRSLIR